MRSVKLSYLVRTIFPIVMGSALLAYIIICAVVLPVTHDESNTCLTYSTMSFHDIVTYESPIPNNHILNTLLIKFFALLFGMHPLTVRLPNILGFVLYFIATWLLIRKITADPLVTFFGFCVMLFNPYLIDFFSLARGYALSISFMMASIYFAFLFLQQQKNNWLTSSVALAILSVYSNFTTLNFYVALILLFGIAALQSYLKKRKSDLHASKQLALCWVIIFSGSLILAGISYLPISKMVATHQFVFGGSNGFYHDTVLTLIYACQYNVEYFNIHARGFSFAIIGFVAIMLLCVVTEFFKRRLNLNDCSQAFFFFLFICSIIINILQYYIAHTPYLIFRTALFFYPLMAINFVFFAEWLRTNWTLSKFYFSIPLSIFAIIHFSRAANLTSCFEWWYDADTYKILSVLDQEHEQRQEEVTLNCNWLFFPSLNFHIITEHKKWIKLAPFHQDFNPDTDTQYSFYYATSDDIKNLETKYDNLLALGWNSRFLMKKKETAEH